MLRNLTIRCLSLVAVMLLTCSTVVYGQAQIDTKSWKIKGYNTVTASAIFATISPDSRSGALGDMGVALSPDVNSMHYNPAKFAFIGLKPGADPEDEDSYVKDKFGIAMNYSPWMVQLSNDINLFNVGAYYKINDKSAVAASMTYFSLGEIEFTGDQGGSPYSMGIYHPNEFCVDATYSRKFSEKISGAVAGRFLYSNLTQGVSVENRDTKAGTSVAADISMYYIDPINLGQKTGTFSFGVNIANIGSKMSYYADKSDKEFVPTNLRLGPALTINIDDYNNFTFAFEVTKYLIPTRPISGVRQNDSLTFSYGYVDNAEVLYGKNDNVSTIVGMFQSFYDAPGYTIDDAGQVHEIGRFREELQEISLAAGVEYWYNNILALRAGYFFEHPRKGDRQYVTLGAGLRYNVFGIDLSYLISTTNANPLGNTLRFSLLLNFGNK